jgi:hypothetical protein
MRMLDVHETSRFDALRCDTGAKLGGTHLYILTGGD